MSWNGAETEEKGGKVNKQDHVMFSVSLFEMSCDICLTGVFFYLFFNPKKMSLG